MDDSLIFAAFAAAGIIMWLAIEAWTANLSLKNARRKSRVLEAAERKAHGTVMRIGGTIKNKISNRLEDQSRISVEKKTSHCFYRITVSMDKQFLLYSISVSLMEDGIYVIGRRPEQSQENFDVLIEPTEQSPIPADEEVNDLTEKALVYLSRYARLYQLA